MFEAETTLIPTDDSMIPVLFDLQTGKSKLLICAESVVWEFEEVGMVLKTEDAKYTVDAV